MSVAQALSPIVDLVYPPRCPLCGESVAAQTGLCSACFGKLEIPGAPSCAKCQRPFSDATAVEQGAICAPCLAAPPRHDGIAAATLYNDASRELVLSFKHGRKIGLASTMGRLMAARLPQVGPDWFVVPVPLHRWRLWHRGYNQAGLLAREITRNTGAILAVDALKRMRSTPSLGGLGRKARAKALSGAIVVSPRWKDRIKGAKCVLVDDVMTSGATSTACVSALKRAGAEAVVISCFARVIDRVESN